MSDPEVSQALAEQQDAGEDGQKRSLHPEMEKELRDLKLSIQQSRLQANRMQNTFEPVSLPPSQATSRVSTHPSTC